MLVERLIVVYRKATVWRLRKTGEYEAALLISIQGAKSMFNLSRSTGLCVLLACSGFLLSSEVQAFDLTGAWSTSADQCGKVFVKKGDQINFAQYSEEFGGGFVVNGDEIRNKATRCTIQSRKESGDTIDLHAACATEIMAQSVQLKIKILNDNSVRRIFDDPDFSGMEMTFHRCTM